MSHPNQKAKATAILYFLLIFFFTFSIELFSEEPYEDPYQTALVPENGQGNSAPATEADIAAQQQQEEQQAVAFLRMKLSKEDGTPSRVVVLSPLDYTNKDLGRPVGTTIQNDLLQYGITNVTTADYVVSSLTVEEFRRAKIRNKADVLLLSVLKPTQFELFLYDARFPYTIFAYSQEIPDPSVQDFNLMAAQYYSRLLVRRVLYLYLQDYYLELPRLQTRPLVVTEIPRWVANQKIFERVNKDTLANVYGTASVGAVLTKGQRGSLWGTNILSGAVGVRIKDQAFAELALNIFSLNVLSLSAKYYFESRASQFLFSVGLGLALAANQHTIDWEQTFDSIPLNSTTFLLAPSIAVLFPVGDAYLKAETIGLIGSGGRVMLAFLPGLLLKF